MNYTGTVSITATWTDGGKEEHNLSDKLNGRQLLMQIYNRKDLTEAFDEFKTLELMDNDEAIDLLNKELDLEHGEPYCTHIDNEHPLVNYYRGVCVNDVELVDADTDKLAREICTIIKDKTRKVMYSKGGKNSKGEKYYVYNEFEHGAEMDNIEKLLFVPYISPDNALTDEENALFNVPLNGEPNNSVITQCQWGESEQMIHDFNEEMLDMPTMGDLQSEGSKIVLTREEAEELFA